MNLYPKLSLRLAKTQLFIAFLIYTMVPGSWVSHSKPTKNKGIKPLWLCLSACSTSTFSGEFTKFFTKNDHFIQLYPWGPHPNRGWVDPYGIQFSVLLSGGPCQLSYIPMLYFCAIYEASGVLLLGHHHQDDIISDLHSQHLTLFTPNIPLG